MKDQELERDNYIMEPSEVSGAISFNKVYPQQAAAIIQNDTDRAVFVVPGFGAAAPTAVFPTSASVPITGGYIPAGKSFRYKLPAGVRHIAAIHAASGGSGNLVITVNPDC